MKFYLVDYENVHESGLVGYDKLDSNAIVYIFISKNTKNLNPKFLSNLSTTIKSIEVESNKKNALDFCLRTLTKVCKIGIITIIE